MNVVTRLGLCAALVCACVCACKPSQGTANKLSISGAWALYPMAVAWSDQYRKLHPEVTIDISAGGAGKGMADVLSGAVDLGMVSREVNPAESAKGAWSIAVVKDAVVPTVSADNPALDALMARGVTQAELRQIWLDATITSWSFAKPELAAPLHAYTRSDACGAAETWAKYLGKNQEDLKGTGVYGDPGVAEAVRADKLGLGFNNLGFVYDAKTKRPVPGLRVVPLDLNGNHVVDPDEQIYDTLDALTAAIAAGRYPSPPARDLYFVSHGPPKSPVVVDFVRFALTDGQASVPAAGYVKLAPEKLASELARLPATPR